MLRPESKISLSLRHCAYCGQVFGPIDLFCELCWEILISELNPHWRTEGTSFPVFCLWKWGKDSSELIPKLLSSFKGGRHFEASLRLGRLIVVRQKRLFSEMDSVVIPIPNSSLKADHSEVLAMAISELSGVEFRESGFQKLSESKQRKKSRLERKSIQFERVTNGSAYPQVIAPKTGTLFLIDDVITTGATLNALRQKFNGSESVVGLCLVNRLC